MCPFCIATAVLVAGSAGSTGGLAAVVSRKFGVKNAEIARTQIEGRNQDVNDRGFEPENSVAR